MQTALSRRSARPFSRSTRPVLLARPTRILATHISNLHVDDIRRKHRIVFLGTPEVAAGVLQDLLIASQQPDSNFEICLVVSQPGKPKGRGNRAVPVPSPVEALARDSGLRLGEQILCPIRAREEDFLRHLEELQPDLAVTAAYGNILPQRFLDIPKYGTLNVHPSLLPKYRGAAPVQRALQDGVTETGVSVAYTVFQCDAGPVLAQERVSVHPNETTPELLRHLFQRGSVLLRERLPDVLAGRGQLMAVPQDESQVLHAAKLNREEGILDFSSSPALSIHNRVRAFSGWPGTSATFWLRDDASAMTEPVEIKIMKTQAPAADNAGSPGVVANAPTRAVSPSASPSYPVAANPSATCPPLELQFSADALLVPCAGGTVLEILQLQPPTKKAMAAKDFRNGLRGKRLLLPPSPASPGDSSV